MVRAAQLKNILLQLSIIVPVTGPLIFASWDSFELPFLVTYVVFVVLGTAKSIDRAIEIFTVAIIMDLVISAILVVSPAFGIGAAAKQYASSMGMIVGLLFALGICTGLSIGLTLGISERVRARIMELRSESDIPLPRGQVDYGVWYRGGYRISQLLSPAVQLTILFLLISIVQGIATRTIDLWEILGTAASIFMGLSGMILLINCTIYAGSFMGGWVGAVVGVPLGRGLNEFGQTRQYLKAMVFPVLGFTFGYFVIVVWFAVLFSAIYRVNQTSSFSISGRSKGVLQFWDFLFFSMMTISTQGYSDLKPQSLLAQALVSVETLLGIAWTVVVFAAIIAYLEPRFARISATGGSRRYRRHVMLGMTAIISSTGSCQVKLANVCGATIS
jgi:hypothetical protein